MDHHHDVMVVVTHRGDRRDELIKNGDRDHAGPNLRKAVLAPCGVRKLSIRLLEGRHPLGSGFATYLSGVSMLLSLVYFAVRHLLRLLTAGRDPDDVARDVEILVLRHQLRVLSRGRRVPLGRCDRILLAAAPAASLRPVAMLSCHSADCPSLAPRARQAQVNLRAQAAARPTESCAGGGDTCPPAGKREPALGLPAHPGRTQEARRLRLGNRHLLSASPPWTLASPAPRRALLERVPLPAGGRHRGLRLLLCGNRVAEDAPCSILHRTLHAQGTSGRGHRPSGFRLGHPASPQRGDGQSLGEDPVPDP